MAPATIERNENNNLDHYLLIACMISSSEYLVHNTNA